MVNIAFTGGGLKGVGYIGCLRALEDLGVSDTAKTFSGVSVGSLAASFAALDIRAHRVQEFVLSLSLDEFRRDIRPLGFFRGEGLNRGDYLFDSIGEFIREETGEVDLVLGEARNLSIYVSDKDWNTISLDYVRFPEMRVVEAIRYACSVPFLFPVQNYMDAGLVPCESNYDVDILVKCSESKIYLPDGGIIVDLSDHTGISGTFDLKRIEPVFLTKEIDRCYWKTMDVLMI